MQQRSGSDFSAGLSNEAFFYRTERRRAGANGRLGQCGVGADGVVLAPERARCGRCDADFDEVGTDVRDRGFGRSDQRDVGSSAGVVDREFDAHAAKFAGIRDPRWGCVRVLWISRVVSTDRADAERRNVLSAYVAPVLINRILETTRSSRCPA